MHFASVQSNCQHKNTGTNWMMGKQISYFFLLLGLYVQGQPIKIYLSPKGNDSANGSQDSPIRSMERLHQLLITKSQVTASEIHVHFQAGIYPLKKTFVLQSTMFQGKKIYFKGLGKGEVVWSGGQPISGWQKENKGIWSAALDGQYFEQIYVDGERAERARTPNSNRKRPVYFLEKVNFTSSEGSGIQEVEFQSLYKMPKLRNGETCEVVVLKDWASFRKQVKETHPRKGRVILNPPFPHFSKEDNAHNTITTPDRVPAYSFFLEGAFNMLDNDNEWAIDKDRLYFKPQKSLNLNEATVFAPSLDTLVYLEGSRKTALSNVNFAGITFSHTSYKLPATGYDGNQAATFYNPTEKAEEPGWLSSAVVAKFSVDCQFFKCHFKNLGTNGLRITKGCRRILVDSCLFQDIGGNGIVAGNNHDPKADTALLVRQVIINQSTITTVGQHFTSGVGIWLGFAADCAILNNEIFDLPYTGISVGWQWNPEPTSSKNNKINFNHVHHVMQELGDGGGIYALGFQPGSEIIGNTIHDVHRSKHHQGSPNNGLYFDEGSKGYYASKNLIYNIAHAPVRGHKTAGVTLEDNELVFDKLPPVFHTPPYDRAVLIYENGEYFWDKPENLPGYQYPNRVYAFTLKNNRMRKAKNQKPKLDQ